MSLQIENELALVLMMQGVLWSGLFWWSRSLEHDASISQRHWLQRVSLFSILVGLAVLAVYLMTPEESWTVTVEAGRTSFAWSLIPLAIALAAFTAPLFSTHRRVLLVATGIGCVAITVSAAMSGLVWMPLTVAPALVIAVVLFPLETQVTDAGSSMTIEPATLCLTGALLSTVTCGGLHFALVAELPSRPLVRTENNLSGSLDWSLLAVGVAGLLGMTMLMLPQNAESSSIVDDPLSAPRRGSEGDDNPRS